MSASRTVSFKVFGVARAFAEIETLACDEQGRQFYALEYSRIVENRHTGAGYSLRVSSLDPDVAQDPRASRFRVALSKKDRQYFAKTIVPLMDAGDFDQARQLWVERLLSR